MKREAISPLEYPACILTPKTGANGALLTQIYRSRQSSISVGGPKYARDSAIGEMLISHCLELYS
jgi:hypothetical protein